MNGRISPYPRGFFHLSFSGIILCFQDAKSSFHAMLEHCRCLSFNMFFFSGSKKSGYFPILFTDICNTNLGLVNFIHYINCNHAVHLTLTRPNTLTNTSGKMGPKLTPNIFQCSVIICAVCFKIPKLKYFQVVRLKTTYGHYIKHFLTYDTFIFFRKIQ